MTATNYDNDRHMLDSDGHIVAVIAVAVVVMICAGLFCGRSIFVAVIVVAVTVTVMVCGCH